AFRLRGGLVIGVARHRRPGQLGVHARLPRSRQIVALNDEYHRTLAIDEPVPVPVEWTAGLLRGVVPGAKRPEGTEGRPDGRGQAAFRAAGEDVVGLS